MEKRDFRGRITAKEEFLYPDSACDILPEELRLTCAQNGRRNIQALFETSGKSIRLTLEGDCAGVEWFELMPVPVAYNTGDGEEQGGAMILRDRPSVKPRYASRQAPFEVYDCMRPIADGLIPVKQGMAAFCVSFRPAEGVPAGERLLYLHIEAEEGRWTLRIRLQVFAVLIPEDRFPITYWFSLEDICRFHQVTFNSDAYLRVLDQYISAMRRVRQNMFFMLLDERCVVSRNPYSFHFEYLTPTIEAFFAKGMRRMEIGPILSRGYRVDGSKDMYTGSFKCAMAPSVPLDSFEGYEITLGYVRQLGRYLKEHGWLEKTVFHIHDEPDIHVADSVAMETRKRDYFLAGSILRRCIPGAQVIEATKSTIFRGGIDILVPDTAGYEANREAFIRLSKMGHEVWSYVCCGPEGDWLNRFLDDEVLKARLLFWGFAKNRIDGFLHWGFNQFPGGMNPFLATECPNDTGIGTDFPCGDSFMVYPGTDAPWLGTRFEAWRMGAEDIELLRMLQKKDPVKADSLIGKLFMDNQHYNADPCHFESVYEELLAALA